MYKSKLQRELDSWHGFASSLRERERTYWEKMKAEVMAEENAVEQSGRFMDVEGLFMSLIFEQAKTIKRLEKEIEALSALKSASGPSSETKE